jgi:hypothetical protein
VKLALLLLAAVPHPEILLRAPETPHAEVQEYSVAWTGTARVHAPGKEIALRVSTRVTPFVRARSETWLLSEGPSSRRTMIIGPEGGWMERDGKRQPMPEATLRHERQQYAIYGLLQIALQVGPRSRSDPSRTIIVKDAPETRFLFDAAGRPVRAYNKVADPEGGPELIPQEFRFSGVIEDDGVKWPRRIEILQRGRPYFTLELETFDAGES